LQLLLKYPLLKFLVNKASIDGLIYHVECRRSKDAVRKLIMKRCRKYGEFTRDNYREIRNKQFAGSKINRFAEISARSLRIKYWSVPLWSNGEDKQSISRHIVKSHHAKQSCGASLNTYLYSIVLLVYVFFIQYYIPFFN